MDLERRQLERQAAAGDLAASIRLGLLDIAATGKAVYGPFWGDEEEKYLYLATLYAM